MHFYRIMLPKVHVQHGASTNRLLDLRNFRREQKEGTNTLPVIFWHKNHGKGGPPTDRFFTGGDDLTNSGIK